MHTVTSDELLFKALSGRTTHNRAELFTSAVYMILYNALSFMRTIADREQLLYSCAREADDENNARQRNEKVRLTQPSSYIGGCYNNYTEPMSLRFKG